MGSSTVRLGEWTKKVRNIVEDDLREELKLIIEEEPDWGWEQISVQDVFGCAINQLTPIYCKVDSEPPYRLSKGEIREALKKAMEKVKRNPIHIRKEI
jgi:hypothetical protein